MKILPLLLAAACALPVYGQIRQQRAAADALFQRYDTAAETTGISVLVIHNGKKLYNKSFGYAEIGSRRKATASTNYRIASVTKSFTAMAIMILRDEGKLSLDDRLTRFFPELAAFGNITVRQLLIHTSGLVSYGDILPAPLTAPLTDTAVLRHLSHQDTTRFPPGARFDYSNTGYVLLGLIVEKASGQAFPAFLQQRIFQPLGMRHSTVNNLEGRIANRAYGYNLKDGQLVAKDQSMFSYLQGDGGIYSSTADCYSWDQALYTDKLVSAATLKEIFTPASWPTPDLGYGYGWEIDKQYGLERVMHTGGSSGFSSYYVRYPGKRFSIILFANQNDGLALAPIAAALERIFLPEAAATQ